MPLTTHTCITIDCDVCGTSLCDHETEHTVHFDIGDAAKAHTAARWLVLGDGRLICTDPDSAHQAEIESAMPPEPLLVPDGQGELDLGLDEPGAGR